MTPSNAKKILKLTGNLSREKIQSAFIKEVKGANSSTDFESHLKKLNVARDVLMQGHTESRELSTVAINELAELKRQHNELVNLNEAKEELRETLRSVKSKSISNLKSVRDSATILAAVSAAAFFGKDRLLELPLSPTGTLAEFELVLLLLGSMCGIAAFVFHRRADQLDVLLDTTNQSLLREVTIRNMLGFVFEDNDELEEHEFDWRLRWFIERVIGKEIGLETRSQKGGKPDAIARSLVPGYTDFLIKAGKVKFETNSLDELIFKK